MSYTKHLIEVLQGIANGARAWESDATFRVNGWFAPDDQSTLNLFNHIAAGYTVRLAPLPDEITLPARVIPAPLREAPLDGTMVYWPDPLKSNDTDCCAWRAGNVSCFLMLSRGLLYDAPEKAIKASKAMRPYA